MRMVSVWDQLLKGLKGVLIQETFYGVEKGTDIIKMILEQDNFYWPAYNGRSGAAGRPGSLVGGMSSLEMGLLWGCVGGYPESTCQHARPTGLKNICSFYFLLTAPGGDLGSGRLVDVGSTVAFLLFS
jgi:hypothetical protein